ncbi:MAG: response regulator [Desulfobulbaceae bacterium]|nr:MAG: response regulator [Desulfobulbaceae bacterium]
MTGKLPRSSAGDHGESGCTVEVRHAGDEGLEPVLSSSFDAAVIDIMLPETDGLTVIERMRRAGIATPVLILSAQPTMLDVGDLEMDLPHHE